MNHVYIIYLFQENLFALKHAGFVPTNLPFCMVSGSSPDMFIGVAGNLKWGYPWIPQYFDDLIDHQVLD